MIYLLAIGSYLASAVVDGLDKFLISKRKILPLSYTFWTVVTGAAVIVIWPWVWEPLEPRQILLALASGVLFPLALYAFFKAMAEGEVSRVVPFVFGLVPVFDIAIGVITGRNILGARELAAASLLVPGAFLVAYKKHLTGKHISLKIFTAFLWSAYYALWQYAGQSADASNSFMWNRLGAAGILLLLLVFPLYRKQVFKHEKVRRKKHTAGLFLFKQALGGGNFIFFSWILLRGKISLINSLQGFRYAFLFVGTWLLSKHGRKLFEEGVSKAEIVPKLCGLGLIILGTFVLFS